ncbi:MAG TPA: glycosyltransferase family 2 protein, partial [Pseudonocardia sp.]|nr:glycosyltransferase family 2 protein [Pseudonocardia sp.]
MTQTVEESVVNPAPTTATLLQRVILPRAGEPMAVRALYVDEHTGIRLATVPAPPGYPPRKDVPLTGIATTGRRLRVLSRTSAVVPEQSEVSFAAYFNAFAAGYWRHWSVLTAVRLHLQLRGTGRVDVYRTKADGSPIYVRGVVLDRAGEHTVDLELDLRPFEDGGWYWFDLT